MQDARSRGQLSDGPHRTNGFLLSGEGYCRRRCQCCRCRRHCRCRKRPLVRRPSWLCGNTDLPVEIGCVEIVLSGNADQREQSVPSCVGERRAHSARRRRFADHADRPFRRQPLARRMGKRGAEAKFGLFPSAPTPVIADACCRWRQSGREGSWRGGQDRGDGPPDIVQLGFTASTRRDPTVCLTIGRAVRRRVFRLAKIVETGQDRKVGRRRALAPDRSSSTSATATDTNVL